MYLKNGSPDYYYQRIRDNIKIVLIGCNQSFENCFCVSMGTNISENYDMSVNAIDGSYEINCKNDEWIVLLIGIIGFGFDLPIIISI